MAIRNNKLGKFFSPVQSYMGYVFIACGILFISSSPFTLLLIIPGAFLAFTYNGTKIDTLNRRFMPYTVLFGVITTGQWSDASDFKEFRIIRSNKKYTTYSRGSVRFDMNITDIELIATVRNSSKKIVLNKFSSFEEAHKYLDELLPIFSPDLKINSPVETESCSKI